MVCQQDEGVGHPLPVDSSVLSSAAPVREFDKGSESLTVAVNGPLIVANVDALIRAAIDGVGLAFISEEGAVPHLSSGAVARGPPP